MAWKLNDNKSDVLIPVQPRYLHAIVYNVVHVGDVSIPISNQFVRNLGVMFDLTPSLKQHIPYIYKASFIQLRSITHLKRRLLELIAHRNNRQMC